MKYFNHHRLKLAMAKHILQAKPSNFTRDWCFFIIATVTILMICAVSFFPGSWPGFSKFYRPNAYDCPQEGRALDMAHESTHGTFYDDKEISYTLDKPVTNWNSKRTEWLMHHPTFSAGVENRVLVLTGSQPKPCKSPVGDHMLLRLFKNKVDYCRRHGYDIFYNDAFLDPKMKSFWAKIPVVRASMLAHPEVEWIFWVDSDAIFTDMDFEIPLERYKDHNVVIHGWPDLIFEKRSWVAANAGVFLIRNCQWSMDLLDVWANMGPRSPDYAKWGRIEKETLKDKMFPESDDQSALIYLVLKEKSKWGNMIYIENEYSLSGYWVEIVNKLDDIAKKDMEVEKRDLRLRRRHAEVMSTSYGKEREQYMGEGRESHDKLRRPFITHFTGCQPCSGEHNPMYAGDFCASGMERALNFADNQVLRNYGFMHPTMSNSSLVEPVVFDFF